MKRWLLLLMLLILPVHGIQASPPSPSLQFGPPFTITGNFLHPFGVAVDNTNGRLLVADTANQRFRWTTISSLNGTYTFTDAGFVANASDPNALSDPQALAVDAISNVYVVNTLAGNVKQFTWNGGNYAINPNFCSNNTHTVDGVEISKPRDIAVGPDGSIYLLDSGNKRILRAANANANSWTVFKSDPSWSNAYGLAVDGSGNIYLADTDNHRILKFAGNTTTVIGHWGVNPLEFRYPRGVTVDQHGRIFVADTFNHRVQVLASNGTHLIDIGHAPGMGMIEKVVIDSSDRLFVVDSDNNQILAFLGAKVIPPFDAFIRDYVGDTGTEPSASNFLISSPDVLVRYQPDIDLAAAASAGLESYAFQQPRYNQVNYVYVAIHNRGAQPALDNFAKLYWYDPGSQGKFPADWKTSGFYSAYSDDTHNTPSNTLSFPLVPGNGVVIAGPILWRPPTPESAVAGDGNFRLGVRISNPYDYPPVGGSTTIARDSNNVSERKIAVIRGPFAAGDQNTLLVRTHFPDISAQTDETVVQTRANELANWIKEVSWGQANVNVLLRGPVTLSHNKTYYDDPSNSRLIEMAQDVLDKLLAAESTLLDGTGPGHEIGRIILVTNDLADTRDWATTGSWPYLVNGQPRYLTVSVQGGNNPTPLFSHGMSHQLNMLDLYAYDNVTFPRPYVDGWDNMAKPMNGAHPLVWEKQLSRWPASRNAKIVFIPRPVPGSTWNNGGQSIPLNYQETAAPGQTVGIAFGLTNGVTSLVDETAFYYVEARKNSGTAAGADSVLPQTGVLMYYANPGIPQGQGPVILRDHVPGGTLNDAAIPVGGSESPAGTGITITVQSGTNGADYNIAVQYNPPATDYDVYMHPGNPDSWMSPDIWVDNQQNGYDEPAKVPADHGEQAIAGEENRVYAHVFNHGPATAYDIEVAFQFSEPYHTVGNEAAFREYMSVFIDQLDGSHDATRYVPWTPRTGIDPHTCTRVQLRRLFNDTNSTNDWVQRNLEVDHSKHGSPYTPIDFPFQIMNGEKDARLFYFRADGVPKGWNWSITPPKAYLNAGEMRSAILHLQPPQNARDCTEHKIYVTGWMPRGDTLVRLGGSSVKVDLQRNTEIDLKTKIEHCTKEDYTQSPPKPHAEREIVNSRTTEPATEETVRGRLRIRTSVRVPVFTLEQEKALAEAISLAQETTTAPPRNESACARVYAGGCTHPALPNQDIVLRYEGPDGKPVYHTVHTDANGCYEDFYVATEGGDWKVTAEYPGDKCYAPADTTGTIVVPLDPVDHPEPDLPDLGRRHCASSFSLDVRGESKLQVKEAAKARECRTTALDQVWRLEVTPNPHVEPRKPPLAGVIFIRDMRHLLDSDSTAGISRGRFQWEDQGFTAIGNIIGQNALGTHHQQICPACNEPFVVPNHLELLLDGVIIEGNYAGARIRASVAVDSTLGPVGSGAAATLRGTVEGAVEKGCDLSKQEIEKRNVRAKREYEAPMAGSCGGELPCLHRVSKSGTGKILLDEFGQDRCKEDTCKTQQSSSRLAISLKHASGETLPPLLADGVLVVQRFIEILEVNSGRGEHGGEFLYSAADGTRISGEMLGTTDTGTHRPPLQESYEQYNAEGHMEGRLWGTVIAGPYKGLKVETRYAAQLQKAKGRSRKLLMSLEGWLIQGCLESPVLQSQPHPEIPEVQIKPTGTTFERLSPDQFRTIADKVYRPIIELPRAAVEAYTVAEGGKLNADQELRLRIADARFRKFDKEQRGYVTLDELAPVVLSPGKGHKTRKGEKSRTQSPIVQEYLDHYDKNHDGVITAAEAGKDWNVFQVLDTNHDNRLSPEELQRAPQELFRKTFDTIDRNSDGRVDFTEFVLWWRTLPKISISAQ